MKDLFLYLLSDVMMRTHSTLLAAVLLLRRRTELGELEFRFKLFFGRRIIMERPQTSPLLAHHLFLLPNTCALVAGWTLDSSGESHIFCR